MAEDPGRPFAVIGRYILSPPIASGGMATVHLACQRAAGDLARTVAVKRMLPHLIVDAELCAMFRDEARVSMRIRHPNVVPVVDVIDGDRELLLVMDYVHGDSLARILTELSIRGASPNPAVAAAIMLQALHGLHAAHETLGSTGESLGVVHRDMSPQNVLIGVDGVARVGDFGIAKAKGRQRTTQNGLVRGKLAYMAPEQIRGKGVTRRTDIFASGIVLWEALTGRSLFGGEEEGATLYNILEAPIPLVSQAGVAVPPAVDLVVSKALERDPELRFETAEAMALALERAIAAAPAREISSLVRETCGALLRERELLLQNLERAVEAAADGRWDAPTAPRPLEAPPTINDDASGEAALVSAGGLGVAPRAIDVTLPSARTPGGVPEASDAQIAEAAARLGARPSTSELGREVVAEHRREKGYGAQVGLLLVLVALGVGGYFARAELSEMLIAPRSSVLIAECGLDVAQACAELGQRYMSGEHAPRDAERAKVLFARACDLSSSDGCIGLARALAKDGADVSKRRELLTKACDSGNPAGCGELGSFLLSAGGSSAEDKKRGVDLLEQACRDYDASSCGRLGDALRRGEGMKQDVERAIVLCERACTRHDPLGCLCAEKINASRQ